MCLGDEIRGVLSVLREFTAEDDILATSPKNLNKRSYVELFRRIDQRIGSLLWAFEGS